MKHGIISGWYSKEDESFNGYYWTGLDWYGKWWAPIDEINMPEGYHD